MSHFEPDVRAGPAGLCRHGGVNEAGSRSHTLDPGCMQQRHSAPAAQVTRASAFLVLPSSASMSRLAFLYRVRFLPLPVPVRLKSA